MQFHLPYLYNVAAKFDVMGHQTPKFIRPYQQKGNSNHEALIQYLFTSGNTRGQFCYHGCACEHSPCGRKQRIVH
jgi:hypothetical protein